MFCVLKTVNLSCPHLVCFGATALFLVDKPAVLPIIVFAPSVQMPTLEKALLLLLLLQKSF